MSRLIGILGGTFDPIHYGHLRPAYEVLCRTGLSQLRFIPNQQPPHREMPQLNAQLRCELIEMAIKTVPEFVLDKREIQRAGASYMVDTLESLRLDFAKDTLCLIMGLDAFKAFQSWHRWQDILNLSHLIVTTRPGYQWHEMLLDDELQSRMTHQADDLARSQQGRILLQSVTQLDISSSQIREALRKGQGTHFLLPDTIREKLEQHNAI